jgi:hypothetical protein
MVFIGNRKDLAGISDDFKDNWITFIRIFNYSFSRSAANKFSENSGEMIKSLNILRHEVMKQNGRLTDDKKHKKVKKNLTALTELFDELIDVITELKERSSNRPKILSYSDIKPTYKKAKKKIKQIKASVRLSVMSYKFIGRRGFLKKSLRYTAVGIVGLLSAGTLSLKVLTKVLPKFAENLPVDKKNGLAIMISYDITSAWYEKLALDFSRDLLPTYVARIELAFGQRANIINGSRTDLLNISKEGQITGALVKGATREDLIKVIRDPTIQNLVVFGHGSWFSWYDNKGDCVASNQLIEERLPKKTGKLLKHTCGVYRKKWDGTGIRYNPKMWSDLIEDNLLVINGMASRGLIFFVERVNPFFSYKKDKLKDGDFFGSIKLSIRHSGSFFGLGFSSGEIIIQTKKDVPNMDSPKLKESLKLISGTGNNKVLPYLNTLLSSLRSYLNEENVVKLKLDKYPLFGTSIYKENHIHGWDRITSPADFIIDPFGNKQEDYIYNLAAEEMVEKERKEKAKKAT